MNQKIKLIALFIILILSGCTTKQAKTTSYISYTQTRQEQDKLISSIYYYDLENKPQKIYEFEYNSGYPLGVFDKQHQSVYFTQKQNGKNQLLKYNINDKNVTTLTTRTTAVNDIVPIKNNKLFITSYDAESKSNIMFPFIYDLNSNELTKLNLDIQISINDVKYDYNTNTLFLLGWLRSDEEKILKEKEGYNIPLQRYIYTYNLDSNKMELLYKGESEFDTFGVDFKNTVLLVENQNKEIISYNYTTKQSEKSIYQGLHNFVFVENENVYSISHDLYKGLREVDKITKISELNRNQEAVNNAVYISQ